MLERNDRTILLTDYPRRKTGKAHAEVEKLMQPRHLLNPEVEREFFVNHHRILHIAHGSVVEQLVHFKHDDFISKHLADEQDLLKALADDLAILEVNNASDKKQIFSLISAAQAYGALYVVLGSNMGRGHISRQLSESVKDRYLNEPRFYSTSADPMPAWRSFKEELNAMGEGYVFRNEVLKGAQATFALFIAVARRI